MKIRTHKQVFTKVNVEVDEGIELVVSALSLFPQLSTRESCQGGNNLSATVFFEYGNTWQKAAEFLFDYLAPKLWERVINETLLSMELYMGNIYLITIEMKPKSIRGVAKAIRATHKEWLGITNQPP